MKRSTRPRDASGRPLPHGTTDGVVEAIPDDLDLEPSAGLAYAQQLLDDGRPFAAHEVLEAQWKAAPAQEREMWRGLAQVCVGLTHLQRGNLVGGVRLLERGAAALRPYEGGAPHHVDAAGVLAAALRIRDSAASLASRAGAPPAAGS